MSVLARIGQRVSWQASPFRLLINFSTISPTFSTFILIIFGIACRRAEGEGGAAGGASFTLHFANLNASEMFDETAAAAAAATATCDAHIDHHLRHEKKVKCLQQVREKAEQEKEGEGEGGCAAATAAAVGNGQWPNDAAPPVTVTLEF